MTARASYFREHRRKLRTKILELLGAKCVRCGYDDARALQIDHCSSDGATERRRYGTAHAYLLKILRDIEAGAARYQVLCANCNWIKRVEEDPA